MIEENLDIITLNRLLNIPDDLNEDYNTNDVVNFEELLYLGGDNLKKKSPSKLTKIFNNIFGGEKQKKLPKNFLNNDNFFKDLYEYYYQGGYFTIIMTYITEILALIFGIVFSVFIFALLDWGKILQCGANNEIIDCGELTMYLIYDKTPNIFFIFIILFSTIFTICKIIIFIYKFRNLKYIHSFYRDKLKLSCKDLQTMSWSKIIVEISRNENINLSINEITNRILRNENYYISLIHKDILEIPKKFYTNQLEINLQYIILSDMQNIGSDKLKRKFILYGIFNLIFSIFILIYLLTYFFVSNIDEFYSKKNILGSRRYRPFYKWKFRDYNELEHFFEKRINKSIPFANDYIQQFPSPIVEVLCKFICLISGSFIGFLLVLSILDESTLLYVRLFDRSLIFYTGIFGAISATARSYLREPEKSIYNPNSTMEKVYKYTHYMPNNWSGKTNTYEVRDEFLKIFVYKFIIFLYDILSVITTPLILLFILPKQSSKISDFIKVHTVDTDNIGPICVYAQFDNKLNDKKMKKSISGFIMNHSLDGFQSLSSSSVENSGINILL
jgi:autophagy-related protein 9